MSMVSNQLSVPKNLRVDGVSRSDYDRLSVAYGLSRLNLGTVSQAPPMEPLASVRHYSEWSDNYIDKDTC